jgi:hypothetical protein
VLVSQHTKHNYMRRASEQDKKKNRWPVTVSGEIK